MKGAPKSFVGAPFFCLDFVDGGLDFPEVMGLVDIVLPLKAPGS